MNFPKKATGISEKKIGDELFLFSPDGTSLSVLNATAMTVWNLCDGLHSEADMAARLKVTFSGIELPVIEADITSCLHEFRRQGLLA